jgi:ABC-type amino acid transport system permease subunit
LPTVSIWQFEAGRALGMRRWTLYTTVILPQVITRVIPPLTNQSIAIIKDTSQVAAIAVMEIIKITEVWVETTASIYDVFLVAALIYLTLTSIAGLAGKLGSPAWSVNWPSAGSPSPNERVRPLSTVSGTCCAAPEGPC